MSESSTRIESWSKRIDKAGGPFYEIRIRIIGNEIPSLEQCTKLEENLKNRARELIKISKGGSVLTEFTDPEKIELRGENKVESDKPTTV